MTRPNTPETFSLNQTEAGRLVGKSSVWLRDKACPRSDAGMYDARVVVQHFIEVANGDDGLALAKLRKQVAVLKEQTAKQHALRCRHQVISRHGMRNIFAALETSLRELAEQLQNRGKEQTPGREVQEMLNATLTGLIESLQTQLTAKGTK